MLSSSDCFGCVSIRNKKYCILNKQYTKEEYEELLPKIIAHMSEMPFISKQTGTKFAYGDFFWLHVVANDQSAGVRMQ